MKGYQIIPDILTDSLEEFLDKLRMVVELTDQLHVDVIDGVFANNVTLMPDELSEIRWGDLRVDVQLMVNEPVEYVKQVDFCDRVFGHVEMMGDKQAFLAECDVVGVKPGWGINIETDLDEIGEELLCSVEAIILMSVKVGHSGQDFLPESLKKIEQLREVGFEGDIVMDGGMNLETIPGALLAGANEFAVNSGLWQTDQVEKRYQELVDLLPAYDE